MLSEDIPFDSVEMAALYFGTQEIPQDMPLWISENNLGVYGQNYVGLEPDSWHMTKWKGRYFLVYVSDDKKTSVIRFEKVGGDRIYPVWRDVGRENYNEGKGWSCDYVYEMGLPAKGSFQSFINWELNPLVDTK